MTTPWIDLAVEGTVAVLLVLTIGYCMLLDSRLKRLRADEANLRATISELLTATEIAERAIHSLRQTASDCDKTLGQRLREAEFFSHEIEKEIGEGEKLLNRIIRITQAARGEAVGRVGGESVAAPVVPVVTGTPALAAATAAATANPRSGSRLAELRNRVNEATDRLGQLKRGAA
jgi:hypothetical protein